METPRQLRYRVPPSAEDEPVNAADEIIREVATRQHWVATRPQLLEAGVSGHVLDARVRRGWLVPVHRAVYRLAEAEPTIRTRAAAAVLATCRGNPDAVAISHVGAVVLWGYAGWDPPVLFDVTGNSPRRVPGVRVHRVVTLDADEVTSLHGIPVTTPARTVLDIASNGTPRELEQALAAAERGAPGCRREILALLQRRPRHAGSGLLRELLRRLDASGRPPRYLRSRAEELAVGMCARAGVAPPLTNSRIAGFEVDLVWPEQRVIVEVDGYEFHGSRAAFDRDRDRNRDLAAAGYHVLRFTWRQLANRPEACLAALCLTLGRALNR
jgi:predicted transcriptional regulator of viral defense system